MVKISVRAISGLHESMFFFSNLQVYVVSSSSGIANLKAPCRINPVVIRQHFQSLVSHSQFSTSHDS